MATPCSSAASKHRLAAADHACLTGSDELHYHARLRDRGLLNAFRNRAASLPPLGCLLTSAKGRL
jgi:hypothetical protein